MCAPTVQQGLFGLIPPLNCFAAVGPGGFFFAADIVVNFFFLMRPRRGSPGNL